MNDHPSSLYTAWFDALPQAFRALVPGPGTSAAPAPDAALESATLPFPADQVGKAINMLDGMLTQLYQGYLPLLAKGQLTAQPLKALADGASDSLQRMLAGWGNPMGALGAVAGQGGAGASQLQLGIERTFGGLGDAFGLRPMRDIEQAWRDMLAASTAKQRAQAEYLALVAQAWSAGTTGLVKELQAMGQRGERVESLLAFIRLWAKCVDAPLHETMQGARGLEVTAKVIRAASRHREQLQKTIGIASEALHVPTRKDMDDAFREIQELKRELRRLKQALPAATQKKLLPNQETDA